MELDTQGAERFFGEPTFEVADLMRTSGRSGRHPNHEPHRHAGPRPKIFSTFMMWLLAELYETSPEVGDPDQPVLAFFFDEAHLLFNDAFDVDAGCGRDDRADDPVQGDRGLLRDP